VVDVLDDSDLADDDDAKPSFFHGLPFLAIVAITLAIVMKTFLVQAFFIPSPSMEKTLHGCSGCVGDRVLVNKVVYKFRDIHRGEIVVFNGKNTEFPSEGSVAPPRNAVDRVLREVKGLVGFGAPGEKDFIKRVIGVGGDVVACCDTTLKNDKGVTIGRITINGQPIDEPYVYLTTDTEPQDPFDPVTVPPGRLFVMGDHRDGSSDSRYHGTIPESSVVGRAFAVFYPFPPFGEKEHRWENRTKVLRVPDVFDPTKQHRAAGPEAALLSPPVLATALAVPVTALVRRRRRSTD